MSKHPMVMSKIAIGCIELLLLLCIVLPVVGSMNLPGAQDPTPMYGAAALWAVVFLIFNCVLMCYWTQFEIAVAVIDSAADFFAATKRIIIFSFVTFGAEVIITGIFVFAEVMLFTMNDFKEEEYLDINGQT